MNKRICLLVAMMLSACTGESSEAGKTSPSETPPSKSPPSDTPSETSPTEAPTIEASPSAGNISDAALPRDCLKQSETGSLSGPPDQRPPTKCCPGLTDRESIEVCGKGLGGAYVYVCTACGNGVCDPTGENRCNCPQDCKSPN